MKKNFLRNYSFFSYWIRQFQGSRWYGLLTIRLFLVVYDYYSIVKERFLQTVMETIGNSIAQSGLLKTASCDSYCGATDQEWHNDHCYGLCVMLCVCILWWSAMSCPVPVIGKVSCPVSVYCDRVGCHIL